MNSSLSPHAYAVKSVLFSVKELCHVWDIVEETNLKNKQLLDAQGAGSYDVFMVDAFWMSEYASKNVLVPISDYAENTVDFYKIFSCFSGFMLYY